MGDGIQGWEEFRLKCILLVRVKVVDFCLLEKLKGDESVPKMKWNLKVGWVVEYGWILFRVWLQNYFKFKKVFY